LARLPSIQMLTIQGIFIGLTLTMFLRIFILIHKDENYDTDDELRMYCKYQSETFIQIIFSPILIFMEIFRPSARKR
ncbi:MAG: hypothetical protein Q8T08_21910, partial [Ignavibacteria bacterium]|nr:hypothetical protein [Ignavibacteria bacterium]